MKNTIIRTLACLLAVLALTLCIAACSGGSDSKLYFQTASGVQITVGDLAGKTIDDLGKWTSQNSSASCGGFEGMDYIYTYTGFRVSTTPSAKGQIICKVEITDDSVKTPQGLYIGMSRADAETAMKGFSSETAGGNLIYSDGEVKLQVVFRDDCIAGITYVAQ
jgi:hypothetical protein